MFINHVLNLYLGAYSPLISLRFVLKAIELPIHVVASISPINLIYIEFILFISFSFFN